MTTARKAFTTSIEEGVSSDFKKTCKELNVNMNDVLESFMRDFTNGKYGVSVETKVTLTVRKP